MDDNVPDWYMFASDDFRTEDITDEEYEMVKTQDEDQRLWWKSLRQK